MKFGQQGTYNVGDPVLPDSLTSFDLTADPDMDQTLAWFAAGIHAMSIASDPEALSLLLFNQLNEAAGFGPILTYGPTPTPAKED